MTVGSPAATPAIRRSGSTGEVLLVFLRLRAQFRRRGEAQAALAGINATVVGLLLAALYNPVWKAGILSAADFAIGLIAFLLLFMWHAPPWLVVVISAFGGAMTVGF
jgi:hypothetical protein